MRSPVMYTVAGPEAVNPSNNEPACMAKEFIKGYPSEMVCHHVVERLRRGDGRGS
jgi:hypothetical protein